MPVLALGFVLRACTLSASEIERIIQRIIPPSEATVYGQSYLPCSWSPYGVLGPQLQDVARDWLVVVGFRDPNPITGLSGGLANDVQAQNLHRQVAGATRSGPRATYEERDIYVSNPKADFSLQHRNPYYDDLGGFVVRQERLLDAFPSYSEKWKLNSQTTVDWGYWRREENMGIGKRS
ncbi:hypothetical protein B0T09DRAFT_346414 [Sordaria sp. MPI-SDFR-AT-0083]|nr:hypothetical protein B0T09DRAFT_346414 [Sordaria sp. MPI-SDFR-AT-0083]